MKCTACLKDLMKKEVLYTEDRLPYCSNLMECTDNHPNSFKNVLERQGAVKMLTEDELESNVFDNLNVSDEMKDRIVKVATKPQSIRLSKIDIAHYLVQLQESKKFSSLSEAIRHCVVIAMEQEPVGHTKPEQVHESEVQKGIKEVASDVMPPQGIKVIVDEFVPVQEEKEEKLVF